jgi:hypothetical protein
MRNPASSVGKRVVPPSFGGTALAFRFTRLRLSGWKRRNQTDADNTKLAILGLPHMTPEEVSFHRTKLAVETRLKRIDQQLAKAQFKLQIEQQASSGWKIFLTPTGAVIGAAALGLVGTAAAKLLGYSASKKQQETAIILKASEVPPTLTPADQERQRARNLLWFANAKYINLSDEYKNELVTMAKLEPGASPPPPIIQTSKFEPPIIPNVRVYLLAGNKSKESLFLPYTQELQSSGYRVLNSKIIEDKFRPPTEEVIYFNKQDQRQAELIAEVVKFKLSIAQLPAKLDADSSVYPGYIEIWFGK